MQPTWTGRSGAAHADEGMPQPRSTGGRGHRRGRPVDDADSRRQQDVARALRGGGDRRAQVLKRSIDLVLGTFLALLSVPLLLVLAITSALTLRAWPLFVQSRPGRDGRPFRIVKIRTMPPTLPSYGHKEDLAPQLRALPAVCRVMRRTHLDELPQLTLVPLGKMSLVGPRPSQPMLYEHIDDAFESMRTAVRPGCTGLWQVGAAHALSLDADPGYDTYYLTHATTRFDIWLLARTGLFMLNLVRPVTIADVPAWVRPRRSVLDRRTGQPERDTDVYGAESD
jgi:lipopolysaccharide/colanic/teichoic acid biosynthesis glycosyltransferase